MSRKIANFLVLMCSMAIMWIMIHIKAGWLYVIAVFVLDILIYGLALYERDKFHSERYDELSAFNERLIEMKS